MTRFPQKTALTVAAFVALVWLLGRAGVVRPVAIEGVARFEPRAGSLPAAAELHTPVFRSKRPGRRAPAPYAGAVNVAAQLSDLDGALDSFYRALQRAEAGQGVARVLHYGDSPVTADSITSDLRALLEERFGDAGHGFVLIAKPWAWYGHRGVDVKGSGWRIQPATQDRARDGFHGLGGVSFEGGPGAVSVLRLESDHARVEVSFLRRPAGGTFEVSAGDIVLGAVDTSGEQKPDWAVFPIPAGQRTIRIQVKSGMARLFGASFEKDSGGVIYNSLGLNGGQVQVVVRYFDQRHWTEELQHARPDLVVVNYGTNESIFPKYIDTLYAGELRTVIQRVKAAVPNASVLIMSPMDRGQRDGSGQIVTYPTVPRIVAIQRQVAAETGCAFFNTFEAMGGAGTMARWYDNQPRLVTADFTHPFPAGARKIGLLANSAMMAGYDRWRSSHSLSAERALSPKGLKN